MFHEHLMNDHKIFFQYCMSQTNENYLLVWCKYDNMGLRLGNFPWGIEQVIWLRFTSPPRGGIGWVNTLCKILHSFDFNHLSLGLAQQAFEKFRSAYGHFGYIPVIMKISNHLDRKYDAFCANGRNHKSFNQFCI
eukprot:NODE_1059_length_2391_cov_1.255672.p3 type:complete len:135 gc:universal NODE_1059_length_2391_cov_1.255672:1182-778(-)